MNPETMKVVLLAIDEVVTINVSDFDETKHRKLGTKGKEKTQPTSDQPPTIVGLNTKDATELVEKAEDEAALDALEAAEKANEEHDGGRKGVLTAINKRREALKSAEAGE